MGLSVREVAAVLEVLGVDRSHGAVWNWTHDLADEKQIEVDGEEKWLYAAIDTESKLLLEIDVYSRRGTDPAAFTRATLTDVVSGKWPRSSRCRPTDGCQCDATSVRNPASSSNAGS
jgi:transposase-like protein